MWFYLLSCLAGTAAAFGSYSSTSCDTTGGASSCPCVGKSADEVTDGTWMEDVPLPVIGDYCGAWGGDFNYCAGGGDSQRPAAVLIFERL